VPIGGQAGQEPLGDEAGGARDGNGGHVHRLTAWSPRLKAQLKATLEATTTATTSTAATKAIATTTPGALEGHRRTPSKPSASPG
jgi:hypothetical protein